MSLKRQAFDTVSNLMIRTLGLNRPSRLYQAFLSKIDVTKVVESNGTRLVFDANKELHLWRAETFHSKEPETIQWINSFAPGSILVDVGANVGVFSLYAAAHRNCQVFAFEPESQNYACLNKNIYLNHLSSRIHAFNVGLDEATKATELHLGSFQSGAANHSVGQAVNVKGEEYRAAFSQSVLAYSFDEFRERFGLPIPNHIKIDVDGNEDKVIRGMKNTLASSVVKSIAIELNDSDQALIDLIKSSGFKIDRQTRAGVYRQNGRENKISNFVFARDQIVL